MRRHIVTGWRERTLWAGSVISIAGLAAALAERATAREFTIAALAAFCVTMQALQVSWVTMRIDRLYQADAEARAAEAEISRAEISAMRLQLARVTGPQLSLVEADQAVPAQGRTRPLRGGSSRS